MNEELSFQLQAFLDGELPETEAREIAALIARDREAAALHTELKHTRAALAKFDETITLPETREFYWSKVAREIRRIAPSVEEPVRHSSKSFWRHALTFATGLAIVIVAIFITLGPRQPLAPTTVATVNDSGAMTYRNYESGATLVWLSFPAENEVTQN
jgi:anti-sigma-K factor RskA